MKMRKPYKRILVVDFETRWSSKDYTLSKLTTEEYIRDERFETIGVGVKEDGQDAVWVAGTHDKIKKYLDSLNLHEHLVLAHNAMFDAAILNWRFDIRPRGWLDTLSMARALHTIEVGGSLAAEPLGEELHLRRRAGPVEAFQHDEPFEYSGLHRRRF